MKDEKALRDLHMNSHSALVNDQPSTMGVEEGAAGELSATLRTLQLLPEIRIDTSRLEKLLSSFQRRLGVLEKSFSTLAGSTAEAVHKVNCSTSSVSKQRGKDHADLATALYIS